MTDQTNQTKRQLVVAVKPAVGLHVGLDPTLAPTMTVGDVRPLTDILRAENITMRPLFGKNEDRLRRMAPALPSPPTGPAMDLSAFYRIDAPQDRLDHLADQFRRQDYVAYAYVEPEVGPPVMPMPAPPLSPPPPTITPDFISRQSYLDASPGGINARFAWTLPGGTGAGVRIIDVEGAWQLSHEDLLKNQGGHVSGTQINDLLWRNHGTAVLGVLGGDSNGFGVTGISPAANLQTISHNSGAASFPSGVAAAIVTAANMLSPGDIILVEAHAPGPRFNFTDVGSQLGFVAMQFWPEVFAAVTYATVVKGIIVVEAAGNGAENLDDPIYSNTAGFPPSWSPFNRGAMDNASIIVGAGAPPPGTHGNDNGPDCSRLDFSNFGSCVDAQGWGREVTTCGYGTLQGGIDEDLWYTDSFSGTSSASPMVAGALACIQGALKARNNVLTPIAARGLLGDFGSVQQDAPGRPATQRIGNRPNLFQMLAAVLV
jgi:hypothetical protein